MPKRRLKIKKDIQHSGSVTINATPYTSIKNLYDESYSGSPEHLNLGLKVTVTIPPTLLTFRYPNVVRGVGKPVISGIDRQSMNQRAAWYKASKRSSITDAKALTRQKAQLKREQARLALWVKAGNAQKIAVFENRIAHRQKTIATIKRRINRGKAYSIEYDITHFVTSLSWSSSTENSKISMEIGLDNVQGLFNYLPAGAKVILWRRKSTNNTGVGAVGGRGPKWYPYIISYLISKNLDADGRNQTMSINCQDRMSRLDRQMPKKKVYKKDAQHLKGWSPREITIDICKREGIPYDASKIPSSVIGRKGKGLKRIPLPRLTNYDPGEDDAKNSATLINDCWQLSVDKLKGKYGIKYPNPHMRTGKLVVEFLSPPGRDINSQKQIIGFTENNIESMNFTESLDDVIANSDRTIGVTGKDKQFTYTVLNAKGKYYITKPMGKGKKKKRVTKSITKTFNPENADLIHAAYGKIPHTHNFKKHIFKNKKEFLVAGQKMMDDGIRPARTLEMSGKAPLGLWPFRFVFVTSRLFGIRGQFPIDIVNYSIEGGNINVSLTLLIDQKHLDNGHSYYKSKKHSKISENLTWY